MRCSNCNATNHQSGAKYCYGCGAKLINNIGLKLKCPNCNETDHEKVAIFCHVCGTRLVEDGTKQSQKSVIWNIRHGTRLTNNCAEQPAPTQNNNDQPHRNMESSLTNKSRAPMFDLLIDQPIGSDYSKAIDLGLPSGTRWAPCNVGAILPHECGNYFAWGEIETKEEYSWNTYSLCENDNKNSCLNIGFAAIMWGSKYDVAHMNWGGRWRMPTREQFMELINECEFQWIEIDSVWGGKFISKTNGNSIFLPATGIAKDNDITSYVQGFYWSCEFDLEHNSNAFALCCSDYRVNCVNCFRKNGLAVRPVII